MGDIRGDLKVSRNISARNLQIQANIVLVSASTLALTNFSPTQYIFTGTSSDQVVKLPVATSLEIGYLFFFHNTSTQTIRILDSTDATLIHLFPDQKVSITLQSNINAAGIWAYIVEDKCLQREITTSDNGVYPIISVPIPLNMACLVKTEIIGVRTGGLLGTQGDCAAYTRSALVKNVAGTISVMLNQSNFTAENQTLWNVQLVPSGPNLDITVQGSSNNLITWNCSTIIKALSF